MKINKMVMAGSLESNDALITLRPSKDKKVNIDLESIVQQQFGDKIEGIINEMIEKFKVTSGSIHIQDRGALDCTLRARLETAFMRAKEAE